MAAVMDVGRLTALLGQAAGHGAALAWIEDAQLLIGPNLGQPRGRIDFAREQFDKVGDHAPDSADQPRSRHEDRSGPVVTRQDGTTQPPLLLDCAAPGTPGRRTGNFALVLEGKIIPARSQRALLLGALQAIERTRPGTMDKLAAEKGRTKRPVARRRELLYEDVKLSKYAEQIEGGWWVATNNSFPEVEKFIRRAAFHAGLHVEIRRAP